MTLQSMREKLAGRGGRQYWRGLEELAGTPEFQQCVQTEFPGLASAMADAVDRRRFLQLMGASMALAGLTGCTRQPKETISPYVEQPETVVPGRPLWYATAVTLGGLATGVLVETHEGRPTRIDGNPQHPASLGAADVFTQAAILGLYDPDRSRTPTNLGDIRPWADLRGILRDVMKAQQARRGAGLHLLSGTVTSPTLAAQIRELLAAYTQAVWHQYEPIARDNIYEGARLAFGAPAETIPHLEKADVILSLDADFLAPGPGALPLIRQFAARRRPRSEGREGGEGEAGAGMNRLYVVECTPTATGAVSDHRLPLRSSDVESFARAVAARVGLRVEAGGGGVAEAHARWIAAVAKDLTSHAGRGVVLAGPGQPPAVHALAHAMNEALGNAGVTVTHAAPAPADTSVQFDSLRRLTAQMKDGQVELLVILGGNPVFTAPADIPFADALQQVALSVHLGEHQDETAVLCQWHLPRAHELESWGDAKSLDGTVTIQQPLIEPLYDGVTAHEVMDALLGRMGRSTYDIVREHWKGVMSRAGDFERWWRRALHDGVVGDGAAATGRRMPLSPGWQESALAPLPAPAQAGGGDLEIVFRADAAVHDGRFANNGWLQELPRPITRLTWDNAALIAPALAERLDLSNGDVVTLKIGGRALDAPVWIVPGQASDSVALHLGYGRRRAGRVGDGVGVDASVLRTSSSPWFARGLEIVKTSRRHDLACTQTHQTMEGRHHVRAGTQEEYERDPGFVREMGEEPGPEMSLYPQFPYEGHAWGMTIDLNACVGCNACVIGCQAENNIPIVGREQVLHGREMHWIRVDRYFEGDLDAPQIYNQPVPCMQCENAPCEPVCPVGATVHSSEGLNDMVYNRCVGTRYCSNNCPYKVRRFNFMLYQDWKTPSLQMMRNPDVSVRSRGVMEKCTYCVQRIQRARIASQEQGRPIRDGEIVTACQQACPAEAIVFGDINDPSSRVSRLKASPRNYGLLAELGTRPRTTYLAALRNPNPELEKA